MNRVPEVVMDTGSMFHIIIYYRILFKVLRKWFAIVQLSDDMHTFST